MKITRRTNIVVRTARRFIIKQEAASETILCERCAEPMISAQAAAQIFVVSSRTIYRLIEQAYIHFTETEVNEIYVCPNSIKQALQIRFAETRAK